MNIEKLAIKAGLTVVDGHWVSGVNTVFKPNLEAFAKALQQSSEPVASVIYEVYVGLDNWREVPKAEYDDYKRTKRTLVTANTTDFCYAELKDIYDEMYQHKDIARVANRLYKLIHSRTHPPASVPLEKYNKLLERIAGLEADNTDLHDASCEKTDLLNKAYAINNKLLDALNKGKNALASARFLFLKHLPDHNWLAGFDKDFDVVKQAIAEAEVKE